MRRLHKGSIVSYLDSWEPVSSAQKLQVKGACQRDQEMFDMEVDGVTVLVACIKQFSEDSY
jgi:hypothetical protein